MYWIQNSDKGLSSNLMKFQKTMCPFNNLKLRGWKDDNLWQFQVAALLKAFLSFATAAPLTWIKECTEEEFWSFLFHSIDLIHFSSTRQKLFWLRWKISFIIVIFILFTRLGCNLKISKHLSKGCPGQMLIFFCWKFWHRRLMLREDDDDDVKCM